MFSRCFLAVVQLESDDGLSSDTWPGFTGQLYVGNEQYIQLASWKSLLGIRAVFWTGSCCTRPTFFTSRTGSKMRRIRWPVTGSMIWVFSCLSHRQSTRNFLLVGALSTEIIDNYVQYSTLRSRVITSLKHSSCFDAVNFDDIFIFSNCRKIRLRFNVCPPLRPSCDAVVSCVYGSVDQHERFTVIYIGFIYTETFTRIGL